jgi:hypothetical protein
MGKIGRIACIATPMAMTIASLLLLIVVFLGGMSKTDANLSSLYYFKVSLNDTAVQHSKKANNRATRPIPPISNTT